MSNEQARELAPEERRIDVTADYKQNLVVLRMPGAPAIAFDLTDARRLAILLRQTANNIDRFRRGEGGSRR